MGAKTANREVDTQSNRKLINQSVNFKTALQRKVLLQNKEAEESFLFPDFRVKMG